MSIVSSSRILAPAGGRILIIPVQVDESEEWKDSISSAGPNTSIDSGVWNKGDQYPSQARSTQEYHLVVLVNFGIGSLTENAKVLTWGKDNHLQPATPRTCFSLAKRYQDLHSNLGLKFMSIISLVACSFTGSQLVLGVWWDRFGREVILEWFGRAWRDDCWFAFVCE